MQLHFINRDILPAITNRRRMRPVVLLLGLCLLVMTANTATAQLVQNGGFETQTDFTGSSYDSITNNPTVFTGWTVTNPTNDTGVWTGSLQGALPYDGNYSAYFGNYDYQGNTTISQNIATTPGASYTVGFAYLPLTHGSGNYHFEAYFGPTTLLDITAPASQSTTWQYFSTTVQATSSTTLLSLGGYDATGYVGIDDVAVTAVSSVPECGTWVAMTCLLGTGAFLTRTSKGRRTIH